MALGLEHGSSETLDLLANPTKSKGAVAQGSSYTVPILSGLRVAFVLWGVIVCDRFDLIPFQWPRRDLVRVLGL